MMGLRLRGKSWLSIQVPGRGFGLGCAEGTRKTRVGLAISMNAEVLASTQFVGEYHADQGTMS